MADTQLLALPYLEAAQAQKHVTHNEALSIIDASVHLALIGRDYAGPPSDPLPGTRVLVGAEPEGLFASHAGKIAVFEDGAWRFLQPRAGWSAFVLDEAAFIVFDGAQWRLIDDLVASLHHLHLLGVGAPADANNPLTVKVNNALFAAREIAEGGVGDLRIGFNREGAAGTVSHIYQTGYSARAETGLAGDDRYRVKVSPDGALWHDAMVVDPASGQVAFPAGLYAPGAGLLPHGAEILWPVANPLPEGFYDTGHRLLSGAAQRAILSVVVSHEVILNALFGGDEDGSWTGDLSAAFSDTAGSTPATWGGSVARVDDASPNGRNALQASASPRPLLARAPVTGRRNLLERTELFSNAYWSEHNATVSQEDGAEWRLSAQAGSSIVPGLSSKSGSASPFAPEDESRFISIEVRAGTHDKVILSLVDFHDPTAGVSPRALFDLTAGALLGVSGAQNGIDAVADAVDIGGGWYRLRLSISSGPESNALRRSLRLNMVSAAAESLSDTRVWSPSGGEHVFIRQPQAEIGAHTPYQRVGNALDVTEQGFPSPAFLRFDLSDDVLPTVLPDGGIFDVMVFGRKGSWIERDIPIAPAGSLSVGPRSFNGAPLRILDATGDIAGWIALDRTITDAERDLLLAYHKARGAGGLLVPAGEELILNGGPTLTHADNWTPTTDVTASAVGGNLRVQNNDPYGLEQSGVAAQTFSTIAGAWYFGQVRAVASSTPSYGIGVGAHPTGTSRELLDLGGQSSLTLRRFVFKATGPSATIKLFNWSEGSGAYADFNDISVRRLIEQEGP